MKFYYLLLIIGLLGSVSFAQSCATSSDCPDDYYCSYGYCVPYSSGYGDYGYGDYYGSSSNIPCCCGSGLILLGLLGAVVYNSKK